MSETKYFGISLVLLSGDLAIEGVGWYICGSSNGGDNGTISPIKISIDEAKEIARSFEAPLISHQDLPLHPFQVISDGTNILKETAIQELVEAEAAAAKISSIRKTLAEFNL